jgi:hypothetical protein
MSQLEQRLHVDGLHPAGFCSSPPFDIETEAETGDTLRWNRTDKLSQADSR